MDTLTTQQLRTQIAVLSEYARLLDNCESENSPQANAIKQRYATDVNSAITAVTAVKNNHATVQATSTTVLAGANNDLVFTAVPLGNLGNALSITYVDPGGATATLGVVVTGGKDIVVNLGRAASAINSTATAVAAAIAAAPAAAALTTAANSGADTGAGLVTAMSKQNFTGGKN